VFWVASFYFVCLFAVGFCFVFTVSVLKHWRRMPRDVVESLSLEALETRLNKVLGNLL